uniref:Uncharacterized protein n=1 Tax=Nelumbo nucifera TaxID=4432 RepID=A0A822ZEA5_NELNU|nr:TPA_asm: hypothetical protein HUJ06_000301 [Nelumbo nucifera]
MPELRSGARQARLRSKRLDDLQPSSQHPDQAENCALPAPNRTGRRVGAGRGRGCNATAVAKGPSGATPARAIPAGRGRANRLIDLDPEAPHEVLPEAAKLAINQAEGVGDKDLAMEGGSAEKLVGVEEEACTDPVPERVCTSCPVFCFKYLCFSHIHAVLMLLISKKKWSCVVDPMPESKQYH